MDQHLSQGFQYCSLITQMVQYKTLHLPPGAKQEKGLVRQGIPAPQSFPQLSDLG